MSHRVRSWISLGFIAALSLTSLSSCESDNASAPSSESDTPAAEAPVTGQPGGPITPAPSASPTSIPLPSPTASVTPTASGDRIFGVTLDDVSNLSATVTSLKNLPKRATARIVFDENVSASNYVTPATQIGQVADVMGEILDSQFVKQISNQGYIDRANQYLDTLGDKVKIWEVGNEINGEWLGTTSDVVAKMSGAYQAVKSRGKTAALTLYYNQDCWSNKSNEMFTWAQGNVPADMKQGLDYVLVSYYEEDCNNLKPDWPTVFHKLAQLFPNSKIGFGEVGTKNASDKAAYLQRYYTLEIPEPNYIGGHFWWYYSEDMVPYTKSLWTTLSETMKQIQ